MTCLRCLAALTLCLAFASCASPYAEQIKELDKAYAAGGIPKEQYYQQRIYLIGEDAQWRREANSRLLAASAASLAQSSAQLQADQAQRAASVPQPVYVPPVHRSYDSTVTPATYPGGPVQVRTEETGY